MDDNVTREFKSSRRRSSVMAYEQSLMFGQFREQLASFARSETQKASNLEAERRKIEKTRSTGHGDTSADRLKRMQRVLVAHCGDWILLILLGVIMGLLSFVFDLIIHTCFNFRDWLVNSTDSFAYQYTLWILYMVTMVMTAAIITRLVSPHAAGSGVAEIKTILRGVVLKEYLSFRTLIAKTLAIPLVLGSGVYLGKEGPCVHIAAMVANQLIKVFGHITSQAEYDSRFLEVIAVACAVGVSAAFASPVGGLLYSIEIVSVYFSVRSYWQGFFAATWSALLWRLLTVWFNVADSITYLFRTDFRTEYPYETLELVPFALLGLICGLGAFVFVTLQRNIVLFNRRQTTFHTLLQRHPLIYPFLVTVLLGIVTFPPFLGQYFASWVGAEQAMHELFSNITWGTIEFDDDHAIVDNWRTSSTSVYTNTFLFFIMNLVLVALSSTMPIPGGLIVPTFKIGAGLGRFYGESIAWMFPTGLNPLGNRTDFPIVVGAYAVAGSAAFSGAATGALSSAVIAFEVTGQLTHLLPIIVCVIVANLVAQHLGPSIYDSLIKLKKLPYLPAIIKSSSASHRIFVEDFMRKDVLYIWQGCSYRYARHLLMANRHVVSYPFVKTPDSMVLLGTVDRLELEDLVHEYVDGDNQMARDSLKRRPPQGGPPVTQQRSSCPVHGEKGPTTVSVAIPEEDADLDDTVSPLLLRNAIEAMNSGKLPLRRKSSAAPPERRPSTLPEDK
ncbi:Chloride channel protein 2 [Halotydeus destructor]|nr:Chloride channel protein 2 [Halotydeus destructor]